MKDLNKLVINDYLYHCTTAKKLQRYKETGCILSPVRGWKYERSAQEWSKKTGRVIILKIKVKVGYPLPDHPPLYHSFWADENISEWESLPVPPQKGEK